MGIYVALRSVPVVVPETFPSKAAYKRGPNPAFPPALEQATMPVPTRPASYTVQKGDNLTRIVRNQLETQGAKPKNADIYAGVRAVAQANNLKNPDKIFPGQQLDLSVLGASPAMPPATTPAQSAPPPVAAVQQPEAIALRAEARRIRVAPKMVPPPRAERLHTHTLPSPPLVPARGGPEHDAHGAAHALKPRATVDLAEYVDRLIAPAAEPVKSAALESPWKRTLGGPARLSSEYGARRDPFTGKHGFHNGIDLAAQRGTPILAFREGVVTFSGWKSGYGKAVVVQHADGLETVYAHNHKNLVREGMRVKAGAPLGEVGSTGRSTGPHLHFEIRQHGEAVNPIPHLEAQEQRLVAAR